MTDAVWTCECGSVSARVPMTGTRIVCYCETCRGFVTRLDKGDRLDAAGGSDLIQVDPQGVSFTAGTEHLKHLRMTETGPLRCYAACCGTPMANTLPVRAVAFASFQVHDIEPKSALPKVTARVHLKGALAKVKEPTGSVLPLVGGLLGRTAKALVSGKWREHPFFKPDGTPIGPREEPKTTTG